MDTKNFTGTQAGVVVHDERAVTAHPFNRKQRRVMSSLARRNKLHAIPAQLFSAAQRAAVLAAFIRLTSAKAI